MYACLELCIHNVYIWWKSLSDVMPGATTIDAHRSAYKGLVDVHTHAIDDDLPDLRRAYPHDSWPSVERTGETEAHLLFGGQPYRRIDHRCWSPEVRLSDMDCNGVAMQLLSPIPVTFCYRASAAGAAELASAQNEFFARIVRQHPTRFAALGAVALQDPDRAVDEMRRCMRHRGFLGVEIGTQVAGMELADPSLDRFFAVAHELGALVLVHPSDQDLPPRVTELGLGFGAGMPIETTLAAAALIVARRARAPARGANLPGTRRRRAAGTDRPTRQRGDYRRYARRLARPAEPAGRAGCGATA